MPQVPTYGAPKVARDPLSAGKLNPVQSNAGEVIGNAVQGLGDAIQSVGQAAFALGDQAAKKAQAKPHWTSWEGDEDGGRALPIVEASDADRAAALQAQRQADQDTAAVSDAQLKFSSGAVQQLGPDGGLTGLQGRDALAAEPQVRQGLADAYNDAVDSLPPGPARAQGVAALAAQRAGAERLVDGYMAGQPAVHFKQSLAARVVGFQQQTAPLCLIDPSLAEHNLGQMDLAQRELDQRSGTPLDHHLANQLQNHSTAWSSLVQNRMAAGDWYKAQEILTDRAGELTYADRARLQPAVTDGVNLADGQAWAEGSLTAGWAGRHGQPGSDPQAAPPVGIDPQVHLVRAAASAAGATVRERERLVAEAVTGGLSAQARADREQPGSGEGGDQTDAAVAAALQRDRTAQQLAGRALGRAPDDWQVAFVARQPAPQAAAALLGGPREADAAGALAGAGISPADARAVLASAGAAPGASVGEALDAARDGYGHALQEAVQVASARPQALFTPDHLPDRDAYLALADLAAGPDPARRQAFRAAAVTHWRDLSAAQMKKRTDALDAVAPELMQGVPYSKWDPAKQAALDPYDRTAFTEAEAHPAPAEGNDVQFAAVRQAFATGSDEFAMYTPADMIRVLNPAQFKQYMDWREDVRKNETDAPTPGQISARRVLGVVQDITGIQPGSVPTDPPVSAALDPGHPNESPGQNASLGESSADDYAGGPMLSRVDAGPGLEEGIEQSQPSMLSRGSGPDAELGSPRQTAVYRDHDQQPSVSWRGQAPGLILASNRGGLTGWAQAKPDYTMSPGLNRFQTPGSGPSPLEEFPVGAADILNHIAEYGEYAKEYDSIRTEVLASSLTMNGSFNLMPVLHSDKVDNAHPGLGYLDGHRFVLVRTSNFGHYDESSRSFVPSDRPDSAADFIAFVGVKREDPAFLDQSHPDEGAGLVAIRFTERYGTVKAAYWDGAVTIGAKPKPKWATEPPESLRDMRSSTIVEDYLRYGFVRGAAPPPRLKHGPSWLYVPH